MSLNEFSFKCVMIIDDTKIDRYLASYVLKKNNFAKEILEFDMVSKAIHFLNENQDNPAMLPQVILLDIRMPEMDGFQFLEKLSAFPESLRKSICIVMLSSTLDAYDQDRADKSMIVKKFLNKPLQKRSFEDIITLYHTSILKEC